MNDEVRGALEALSPETTVELSYMSSETMGHVLARVPASKLLAALSSTPPAEMRERVALYLRDMAPVADKHVLDCTSTGELRLGDVRSAFLSLAQGEGAEQ